MEPVERLQGPGQEGISRMEGPTDYRLQFLSNTQESESLKCCQGPLLEACGQNAACRHVLFYLQYITFLIKFSLQY